MRLDKHYLFDLFSDCWLSYAIMTTGNFKWIGGGGGAGVWTGESTSGCFTTSNGVRQGGILSPKLFSVYIDDLSDKLVK